jgi:hypothetical protein
MIINLSMEMIYSYGLSYMLTRNLRMTSICLGDHMATYYHFCAISWNIVCLTIHLYKLSLLSITCKIEVFSPISLIQKRQLLAILGNGFLPCSNRSFGRCFATAPQSTPKWPQLGRHIYWSIYETPMKGPILQGPS